jgi:hypothetical protein
MWLIPILAILCAAPLGGLPRYRLAADPFLLMLAAVGFMWLLTGVSSRRAAAA